MLIALDEYMPAHFSPDNRPKCSARIVNLRTGFPDYQRRHALFICTQAMDRDYTFTTGQVEDAKQEPTGHNFVPGANEDRVLEMLQTIGVHRSNFSFELAYQIYFKVSPSEDTRLSLLNKTVPKAFSLSLFVKMT
jgi:hypothetical protein